MNPINELTQEELRRTLDVFCSDILQPVLQKLEDESLQRLNTTVEVLCDNTIVLSQQLASVTSHVGDAVTLRVRVRIGQGSKKGRYRFRCQAISTGLAQETGFSGFSMSGSIDQSSSSETVVDSLSYRYNVRDWDSNFQA